MPAINGKPITEYFDQLEAMLIDGRMDDISFNLLDMQARNEPSRRLEECRLYCTGVGIYSYYQRLDLQGHESFSLNFNTGPQTLLLNWNKRSFNRAFTLFLQGYESRGKRTTKLLISSIAQLTHIDFVESRNLMALTFKTVQDTEFVFEIEYTTNN